MRDGISWGAEELEEALDALKRDPILTPFERSQIRSAQIEERDLFMDEAFDDFEPVVPEQGHNWKWVY
jgi:hypothetical protein